MIDSLISLDLYFFHLINNGANESFLVAWMPLLREKWIWLPVYAFILSFVLRNFKLDSALFFIGFLFITIGTTDLVTSQILKKEIKRLRPCAYEDVNLNLLVPCGSGYSMPSSHAANHFALSLFLVFGFSGCSILIRMALILWAVLISVAQIFVGVHFPSDVIIGALVGGLMAWSLYQIYKRIIEPYYPMVHNISSS